MSIVHVRVGPGRLRAAGRRCAHQLGGQDLPGGDPDDERICIYRSTDLQHHSAGERFQVVISLPIINLPKLRLNSDVVSKIHRVLP